MIQSRKINIIVVTAVVFAMITSFALVVTGNTQNKNGGMRTMTEYTTKIFGTDIISIEIIADEADWQEMLDNATSEQYIMADVVVNGTKFQNVGIRPKGNSSLTQVASSDSDRYSFRLQFDEYIKGQTCFGLESFVINNMAGDNTYMKEYVSYELMQEIDVDAPYFGFADIKVNGEGWGLYLAVETCGDSYEARTFGTTSGMMYNVKSMDMGGNNKDGNDFPQGDAKPPANGQGGNFPQDGMQPPINWQGERKQQNTQAEAIPSTKTPPNRQNGGRQLERPNGNFGGPMGGRGSNGGSLEYTTDEVSSYSAIFNNVTGKGDGSDFKRVITALKALSTGQNLEAYFGLPMAKILICDDEEGLRAVIKRYALFEGHEVFEACDGMEAVELCKNQTFDIIIMDVMMPELDGFTAVKEIRKAADTPVIMLSARGEEYDKVLGFEMGVDDYVVKPFSSKEIMLRVNAILRRIKTSQSPKEQDGHIIFEKDGFLADLTAYKVFIDGTQVDMAPKEYDLLFFLIRNRNIAVPREKILTEVWGHDYFGDDRTLDTHMKLLRRHIGKYAGLITTLRGLGYRFDG